MAIFSCAENRECIKTTVCEFCKYQRNTKDIKSAWLKHSKQATEFMLETVQPKKFLIKFCYTESNHKSGG